MIRLAAHGWQVTVDPTRGATITDAVWQGQKILAPLTVDVGFHGGCFVMAPFANRIADGRFAAGETEFSIPVNRPSENMAIHGVARDRSWRVDQATEDRASMTLNVAEPDLPWRFRLRQDVELSAQGLRVSLELTSRSAQTMPFGMGLHPWFPKQPGTTLSFSADGAHRRDARGLPLPQTDPRPEFGANPTPLDQVAWFDGCFSGWTPREAVIRWPELSLRMTADGALRHLHVYVPDDQPVFCAEPVSHLPDAINRPELGAAAQMTLLAKGETLSGSMTLEPQDFRKTERP